MEPRYLIAPVPRHEAAHSDLGSIVLFGLPVADGRVVYLEIRYRDYETGLVDGDHLHASLEEAFASLQQERGIFRQVWRPLSPDAIARIDAIIRH